MTRYATTQEFFASSAVRPTLTPQPGVRVAVHVVTELAGVGRS